MVLNSALFRMKGVCKSNLGPIYRYRKTKRRIEPTQRLSRTFLQLLFSLFFLTTECSTGLKFLLREKLWLRDCHSWFRINEIRTHFRQDLEYPNWGVLSFLLSLPLNKIQDSTIKSVKPAPVSCWYVTDLFSLMSLFRRPLLPSGTSDFSKKSSWIRLYTYIHRLLAHFAAKAATVSVALQVFFFCLISFSFLIVFSSSLKWSCVLLTVLSRLSPI
jgi:hypothetical protein